LIATHLLAFDLLNSIALREVTGTTLTELDLLPPFELHNVKAMILQATSFVNSLAIIQLYAMFLTEFDLWQPLSLSNMKGMDLKAIHLIPWNPTTPVYEKSIILYLSN
jgi:hypothetical protein